MSNREGSRFADHPRVTWFGHGLVAYVDYTTATTSWFIGGNGFGRFHVIPPDVPVNQFCNFSTFDEAVEYALANAPRATGPG